MGGTPRFSPCFPAKQPRLSCEKAGGRVNDGDGDEAKLIIATSAETFSHLCGTEKAGTEDYHLHILHWQMMFPMLGFPAEFHLDPV